MPYEIKIKDSKFYYLYNEEEKGFVETTVEKIKNMEEKQNLIIKNTIYSQHMNN